MIQEIKGENGKLYIVDENGNEHEVLPTEIFNTTAYEPYELCGKNLFDSGELVMNEPPCYGKTYATCSAFDELCDRVEKIENKEKEGIDMVKNHLELLNLYKTKSEKNIEDYYNKLMKEELDKDEVGIEFNKVMDNIRKELLDLYEKYGNHNSPTGSYVEYCCGDTIEEFSSDELPFYVEYGLTDAQQEIIGKKEQDLQYIIDIIEEITAHCNLMPPVETGTHDAVMDLLRSYNVVDCSGRLTPFIPGLEEAKHAGRQKKDN